MSIPLFEANPTTIHLDLEGYFLEEENQEVLDKAFELEEMFNYSYDDILDAESTDQLLTQLLGKPPVRFNLHVAEIEYAKDYQTTLTIFVEA